jgi:prophage DNA circulation protein
MSERIFEEMERMHPQFSTSSCLIKDKKRIILEQLENAISKLKEDRLAIRRVVRVLLNMKEAGDDVANQVVATVAQIFADNTDSWLKRAKEFELWFPKLKY